MAIDYARTCKRITLPDDDNDDQHHQKIGGIIKNEKSNNNLEAITQFLQKWH